MGGAADASQGPRFVHQFQEPETRVSGNMEGWDREGTGVPGALMGRGGSHPSSPRSTSAFMDPCPGPQCPPL